MANTVYRRVITWVTAPAVLLGMLGVSTDRAAAAGSGCPDVSQQKVDSGTTPILFVHGINSGPWVWTPEPGGTTGNVEGTNDPPLKYIENSLGNDKATGYTFDWSADSGATGGPVQWVTMPTLGRRLSQAIECVAHHAGRRVIIIAWSMGGLLAQDASSIDPGDIGAVFTLGTPYRGSWLASAFAGQAPDDLSQLANAIIAACSFANLPQCHLVNERNDPGVEAMRLNGGPQGGWTNLPPWPTTTTTAPSLSPSSTSNTSTTTAAFPVYSLAGSITGSWQPLWPLTIGEMPLTGSGDWVVDTGSQRGTWPGMTLSCPVTLGNPLSASASIVDLLGTAPCIHMNEPDSKALLDYIITAVKPMLPTAISVTVQLESCGPIVTGVDGSGGPITCHDRRPSLAADHYFRQGHFTVLNLGPDATLKQVEAAMCYDVKHALAGIPMDADAALLAGAEQGWSYSPSLLGDPWKVCGLLGG